MSDFQLRLIPIISVLLIYSARMKELATKRQVISGTIREKMTFRLFMLSGMIALGGGILEYLLRGMPLSWAFQIAGWVFALTSFMIRRAAIKALGQFWSLHNEVRENHQFVQSGPFRWVRHPTYFSMILELLSGGLILSAPVATIGAMLIFIPALKMRVFMEEADLIQKFDGAYKAYCKHTPAVMPFTR